MRGMCTDTHTQQSSRIYERHTWNIKLVTFSRVRGLPALRTCFSVEQEVLFERKNFHDLCHRWDLVSDWIKKFFKSLNSVCLCCSVLDLSLLPHSRYFTYWSWSSSRFPLAALFVAHFSMCSIFFSFSTCLFSPICLKSACLKVRFVPLVLFPLCAGSSLFFLTSCSKLKWNLTTK